MQKQTRVKFSDHTIFIFVFPENIRFFIKAKSPNHLFCVMTDSLWFVASCLSKLLFFFFSPDLTCSLFGAASRSEDTVQPLVTTF